MMAACRRKARGRETLLADSDAWWVKTTQRPDGSLQRRALIYIGGVVDVPDKGVYVLIGHHPVPKGEGRAELIRIDGVYEKWCSN